MEVTYRHKTWSTATVSQQHDVFLKDKKKKERKKKKEKPNDLVLKFSYGKAAEQVSTDTKKKSKNKLAKNNTSPSTHSEDFFK